MPGAETYPTLTERLGYVFTNQSLLERALTHSTYAYENQDCRGDNERLEFLGDAVLQLAVSQYLYQCDEKLTEGEMTRTRALVVCEPTLARVARLLGLGAHLQLGKGERASGGEEKASNLSNAVEAILGATFLDGGLEAACALTLRFLEPFIKEARIGKIVYDYKSRLFEKVQSTHGQNTLQFEILAEEGPVHQRTFTAAAVLDGKTIATGTGSSKKDAEQMAAREALLYLDSDTQSCRAVPEAR